jgi:hypothetical protein
MSCSCLFEQNSVLGILRGYILFSLLEGSSKYVVFQVGSRWGLPKVGEVQDLSMIMESQ